MPRDELGNITTVAPEKIETLHDRILAGADVIPLKVGGMAYLPQDTGEGVAIPTETVAETPPAAG